VSITWSLGALFSKTRVTMVERRSEDTRLRSKRLTGAIRAENSGNVNFPGASVYGPFYIGQADDSSDPFDLDRFLCKTGDFSECLRIKYIITLDNDSNYFI
jgi:hypothetical protein